MAHDKVLERLHPFNQRRGTRGGPTNVKEPTALIPQAEFNELAPQFEFDGHISFFKLMVNVHDELVLVLCQPSFVHGHDWQLLLHDLLQTVVVVDLMQVCDTVLALEQEL